MYNDSFFISLLSQLARIVPTLLVCIIGIMMIQTRPLPKTTKTLATSGLFLTILGALGTVIFSVYLSSGSPDYSSSSFRLMQINYGAISQVLHAVALVLLILAVCKKGQTEPAKSDVKNPYEP
jgi:hypothetical protein